MQVMADSTEMRSCLKRFVSQSVGLNSNPWGYDGRSAEGLSEAYLTIFGALLSRFQS
jgi:hypothetical protein